MKKTGIYTNEEKDFSPISFKNPKVEYAPFYHWVWNGPVTKEETIAQLDEMERMGIRATYILPIPRTFRPLSFPSRLEPEYLTPEYFKAYEFAVSEAKKRGMNLWLYDEGGWPSGGGCGNVLMNHPQYAKRSLEKREITLKAGQTYKSDDQCTKAFLKDGTPVFDGYKAKSEEQLEEYFSDASLFRVPGHPDYPDISRKEATQAFIDEALETYTPLVGKHFGDALQAVFTDEPKLPAAVPYRQGLVEEFEKTYGYSPYPFLPAIYDEKRAKTEDEKRARINWFDMCSEFMCQGFLLPEKKWANEHNMSFTGHVDIDHDSIGTMTGGHFGIMRSLRCFDIPGIDVIWRQIFPAERPEQRFDKHDIIGQNTIFPRYASSAAAQIGAKRTMTETAAVYGAGVTFEELRYVMNYQAVRGINTFDFFSVPYARTGFQMTGELPFFTEKHACYSDLPHFNAYLERLSYVASVGKADNKVALYMPVKDIYSGEDTQGFCDEFEALGGSMEDALIPFDIIDDDVFALCDKDALKNGEIRIGDALYTTVVISRCNYASCIDALEEFALGGGKVLLKKGGCRRKIKGSTSFENVSDVLASPVEFTKKCKSLRLGVRKCQGGTLIMVFNEGVTGGEFSLKLDEKAYLCDLEKGDIILPSSENGEISCTLSSGDMAVIFAGVPLEEDKKEDVFEGGSEHKGQWYFTAQKEFIIGEMEYITIDHPQSFTPAALGDWKDIVGEEYSGSGVYKTSFKKVSEDARVRLDLGEVFYTCEAFLNGKSLGVKFAPPYIFDIDSKELMEENTLLVRVSNTAANAYHHTKSFDRWQQWQMPYTEKENIFHRDYLKGGLKGPLTIYTQSKN